MTKRGLVPGFGLCWRAKRASLALGAPLSPRGTEGPWVPPWVTGPEALRAGGLGKHGSTYKSGVPCATRASKGGGLAVSGVARLSISVSWHRFLNSSGRIFEPSWMLKTIRI